MRAACERDPLSVVFRTHAGAPLYFLKQYDAALTEFQTALTMNPKYSSAHWYVGLVHLGTGALARAVASFEKAVEFSGGLAGDVCALCHALALAGRVSEAEAVLAKLTAMAERRYVPPFFFALAHLTLGRPTEGYNWLDVALSERDYYLVNLRTDPRFDPYRTDPRFVRVAAAVSGPDDPNGELITGPMTG
jgi:tetratricopeptide (TPR) repeat protein